MITQQQVKELFRYEDGQLIRLTTIRLNSKKGDIVGCKDRNGYLKVFINNKCCLVHRVIFLYHHGYLPNKIDHINCKPGDNRIENLRECTTPQNAHNSKKIDNCSSKYKGVCWCVKSSMWRGYICAYGVRLDLGRFWDEETAAQMVAIERLKLHGEFANDGGVS